MLLLSDLIMYSMTLKDINFFVIQSICLDLKNRSALATAHKKMNLHQVKMMLKFKMPLMNSFLRIILVRLKVYPMMKKVWKQLCKDQKVHQEVQRST